MTTWRERFGLHALEYPVPQYSRQIDYLLGGIALFGFLILVLTGFWMTLSYKAGLNTAYESVRALQGFDRWIRNLHFWVAHLTFLTVLLHLFYVAITGAYRSPRQVTWWLGVALLTFASSLFLTGTIIKWDQEGYEAYAHIEAGIRYAGFLAGFLLGKFTGPNAFSTFFFAHISLLPIVVLAILGWHLALVRIHGISERPTSSDNSFPISFTQVIKAISLYSVGLFILLILLASLFPAPLGKKFIEGVEVTKPPWPFLWLYAVENFLGTFALVIAPALVFLGLIVLPLVDRKGKRRVWIFFIILAFLLFIALGIYAAISAPVSHLEMGMGNSK